MIENKIIKNIKKGIKDVGTVSFFNKSDILKLFEKKYKIIHLEHNKRKYLNPIQKSSHGGTLSVKKYGL